MAYLIYRFLMPGLTFLAGIVGMFNPKLKLRKKGLKSQTVPHLHNCIWIHCASLGEFEQGKVLIDALRERFPDHKLVLTFFSASGYERKKNYPKVDHVLYLPYDTYPVMKQFVTTLDPQLVIFIKYEFWFNLLEVLNNRQIPFIFVSAVFRPTQYLFKRGFASLLKRILRARHIFVQNSSSMDLLLAQGYKKVTIAGDTRIDRVLELRDQEFKWPALENWIGGHTAVIAGSTWPKDELLIRQCILEFPDWKWVIAPHEVTPEHLSVLRQDLVDQAIFLSDLGMDQAISSEYNVLVIDRIGLLSLIYRYGTIAYIGGGHGAGIHNTLEPAVYGLPLIFGPKHENFQEAVNFCKLGTAQVVRSVGDLQQSLRYFDAAIRSDTIQATLREYFVERAGVSDKIISRIENIISGK